MLLSLPNDDRLMVLGFSPPPPSDGTANGVVTGEVVVLAGTDGGCVERRDVVHEWDGLGVLQEVRGVRERRGGRGGGKKRCVVEVVV